MKTHALATLFCVLSLWPSVGKSAWGTNGCGPVGPRVLPVLDRWVQHEGAWYFYRAGSQIAGYDPETKVYRTYDSVTDTWGKPAAPPWEPRTMRRPNCVCPQCSCVSGEDGCGCLDPESGRKIERVDGLDVTNFGVDQSQLLKKGASESYTINGSSVTRRKAAEVMTGPDLTDDSGKMRLTVIGSEADRKAVLTDIEKSPVLAPLKDKFLAQDYAPDHWAVAGTGFVTTGHPTVYVQAPGGQVLHRQDDYAGGAEALAEAIRKIDPNYKSANDKDLRKNDATTSFLDYLKTPWAIVGAIGGLFLALLRKKAMS